MNLLFIGNSYTDDMQMYLPDFIMEKDIKNVNLYSLVYGGCTVDQHIDFISNNKNVYTLRYYDFNEKLWKQGDNAAFLDVCNQFDWDYISIQQASFLSAVKDSLSRVDELIKIIKNNIKNKNFKFIWHLTWPYPTENCFEVFEKDFSKDYLKMYDGIIANVKKYILNNPEISLVIPDGTAIVNAKQIYDDRCLYRDVVHLSFHRGRYIASLVAFSLIFKEDVTSINYRPFSMMNIDKERCKMIAAYTLNNPYEFSKIDFGDLK